jgi:cephalosporin hydroxylase
MKSFEQTVEERVAANGENADLSAQAQAFMRSSIGPQYSYNFSWLGRPIIQYPQDMIAMQEIIWRVQPDLIIETGVAHGGSLIFSASMLELVALCGGPRDAHVLGIDIDIRDHNRKAIEAHPMSRRISLIQGSSVAPEVVTLARDAARGDKRVLVSLDSNHTHEHVLAELEVYAPMVSVGSYCVVFDTVIDDMPAEMFPDRPWKPGNNPKTAVHRYLENHPEFEIDHQVEHKLLITVAPDGYLRRVA